MIQVHEAASNSVIEVEAEDLVWVRGRTTSKWGDRDACWASLEAAITAEDLAREGLETASYEAGKPAPWVNARLFSRDGATLWLVEAK